MRFIDEARVYLRAGKGGDGAIALLLKLLAVS